MKIKNSEESFGVFAQVFHWSIFLLFVSLFVVANMMTDMPKGPEKFQLYGLHKALGITTLFIVFLRLSWRMANPVPAPSNKVSQGVNRAGSIGHFLLYAVMFIMPISGYIMSMAGGHKVSWFGMFNLPLLIGKSKALGELAQGIHSFTALFIVILVSGHLLAALWHHFVIKDGVLRRMLPLKEKESSANNKEEVNQYA